jgi:ABC-type maltose transport system permease subunit
MATTSPQIGRITASGPVQSNRRLSVAIRIAILIVASAFAIYPFIVVVSASFNPANSISATQLIPPNPSLSNYERLFNNPQIPIATWLVNSLIVSSISTILATALTTLAAFAFSRFRYYGRQSTLLFTLVIQVFPVVVALSAIYLLLQQIGKIVPAFGLNSLGGIILIYCGGALGSGAFLMKGYFDTIPRDIDESASVDGATQWTTFWRVILPLVRPILAVNGLLTFIGTFNDYLLPRVLLRDNNVKTLAVGLTSFLDGQFNINWGVFAAGALISTFPIIIMFLILQTQIVSGLSQGAVKG